ncbi:MAG: glycosyltransferase family 4 protein, partial [Minisyncoccia bacterium]
PSAVVSNPIEAPFFEYRETKENLKKKFGLNNLTVLCVGRISEEKKIDTIIDAFIDFSKEKNNVTLVIIGEGSLRKKFEKSVSESEKSSQIKFLGPYIGENKQNLFDIFHASDIFTIAGVFETQSMCMLQAMASGLPVIASRGGALPDIVGKENGLLFDIGNSDQLTKQLEILYSNTKLREQFAKNARNFCEKLTVENIANEWEKIYNAVIEDYNDKQQK